MSPFPEKVQAIISWSGARVASEEKIIPPSKPTNADPYSEQTFKLAFEESHAHPVTAGAEIVHPLEPH